MTNPNFFVGAHITEKRTGGHVHGRVEYGMVDGRDELTLGWSEKGTGYSRTTYWAKDAWSRHVVNNEDGSIQVVLVREDRDTRQYDVPAFDAYAYVIELKKN
ncbi:MAG: hypothetical protein A2507_00395 [Candidatus Magasanikbacteria bacterium RIFOXYD12_FULL_33_17]|nr:MAG: hypothetical protein A2507_00395 [Candidatus Magasanikbacteria bacterium RIFOXYD12_FULL_33_17]